MKPRTLRWIAAAMLLAAIAMPGRASLIVETAFQRKMPVAFSGYAGTSTLTNFPALVRLDASISGFNYDLFAEGGANLRFADEAGTLLDYEIDTWNTNGSSLIWVRVPALTASTDIWAYWGSGDSQHAASQTDGSVWGSATYTGVWHLNEAGASSADATANNLDGSNGSTTYVAAGKLGAARQISNGAKGLKDGNGIVVPNYNSLGVGNSFTVSTWLKYKTGQVPGYDRILGRKSTYNSTDGWEITLRDGSTTLLDHRGANGDSQQSAVFSNVSDGNWQFLTVIYDGTTSRVYLNGAWKSTKTIAAATDNNKTLTFGNNQALNEASFKGSLDEMRLRDAVSSVDWIAAEYATVANAAFAAYGTIEAIVADLPALGVSTVADVDFHSADLTYTVTRLGTSNPDILIAYGTSAENLSQTNLVATGISATDTYGHTLTGLLCSTTYYARHLATNASGSAQSGVFSFTTPGDPALGTTTITATGTTLDIAGSLTDIGVSNATVELWFGTSSNTLAVIETWPSLSAPQTFSKTLSSQPFGTYYCAFRAYNVCNGATNETWTAVASDTVFGTCTWTGGAGDQNWNNPANWNSGTVPGFKDTAVLTDSGLSGTPTLKLNASQRVFKLVIQTINPFTIGNAFDKTNATPNTLTLTDLERQDVTGTEGLHVFGTAVVLFPDNTGNANWVVNGSSELRTTASLDGAVAGVGLVKTGTGTLALNDNTTYTGTTTVLEGAVTRLNWNSFINNLQGNVVVGSPEGTVPASYSAQNGGRPKNATVYPNGTYTQGDWPAMGFLTIIGGTANTSWSNIDGDIKMTGGSLNGGPIERGGTAHYTYASPTTARITGNIRMNEYAGSDSFFDVQDGDAPIDLWCSGPIDTRSTSRSIIKRGPGVMRLTSTGSSFNEKNFYVNVGTALIDNTSGSGSGKATVVVAGGATLGGTGFIGGVANYTNANVSATGTSGNLAVVAPGSIDPATGTHVLGTLTVGSGTRANNVTFGAYSTLKVTIGANDACDSLAVNGTISLATATDKLDLTLDENAKTGVYVLASATGGITGTFNTWSDPMLARHLVYTGTTVEYWLTAPSVIVIR